ncbi:Short-chain dehydrogenase/reductase SDR [Penicillium atrosanguineum]|uniref:Short-chain dehydrogenase/reductase SDR n=1 Tax=Penicillium atrosanguineum TaxID=1132637 RepID=UPI0023A2D3B4|nr:Short-chain dehydrogenase/reductase SDR [Penicillium atrosanguineum]KAJ5310088.1 Short-chain dehydrogenase/reductase SDR [Penicillium atrosanguineum]
MERHSDEDTRTSTDSSSSDAASRRRLQNRLNQQASRRRKALQVAKQGRGQEQRWVIYTDEANAPSVKNITAVANSAYLMKPPPIRNYGKDFYYDSNQSTRVKCYADLQKMVAEGAANKVQSPELLLPVVQFNMMRAAFENAASMGLTWNILSEDIASYFNIAGPVTLHLPPSLEPSDMQKSIIHHPWIDLIPISSLRDAILRQADNFDEDQLCGDFYGICGPSPEVGILVWGESWDPSAYEVSERCLNKWVGLFKDCPELVRSTNYWRRKRGEKPLRLPDLTKFCVEELTH